MPLLANSAYTSSVARLCRLKENHLALGIAIRRMQELNTLSVSHPVVAARAADQRVASYLFSTAAAIECLGTPAIESEGWN